MNVVESNKLIAEFMGAYIAKKGMQAYDMDDKFPNGTDRQIPEVMEYPSSWDWLMPVVEKIESLSYQDDRIYHQLEGNSYLMFVRQSIATTTDIKGVYEEILQLIKWYNENK